LLFFHFFHFFTSVAALHTLTDLKDLLHLTERANTCVYWVGWDGARAAGTGRVGAGVPGTPMRDGLAINDPDSLAAAASSTAREAKERLRGLQGELRSGLGALPAPKNEYQVRAKK